MARYNYMCQTCRPEDARNIDAMFVMVSQDHLVWEEQHGMSESPAIKCPACRLPAKKTMLGVNIVAYVKGNGWLDTAGRRRDMNRYKLANDDPYAQYRQPGEKDHIIDQLKHPPKQSKIIGISGTKKSKD